MLVETTTKWQGRKRAGQVGAVCVAKKKGQGEERGLLQRGKSSQEGSERHATTEGQGDLGARPITSARRAQWTTSGLC
jgi:hypothetical protein